MSKSILKSLSTVTNVPEAYLAKLEDIKASLIGQQVLETIDGTHTVVEVDIGIGVLGIQVIDNCISYKFIPGRNLEKSINSALNNQSTLESLIECKIAEKIDKIYKELL